VQEKRLARLIRRKGLPAEQSARRGNRRTPLWETKSFSNLYRPDRPLRLQATPRIFEGGGTPLAVQVLLKSGLR
jgi:hypothetical protein